MDEIRSLQERIERLEATVAELQQAVAASRAEALPAQPRALASTRRARRVPDFLWDGEFWLNKLGIGLLLLGVAFLFRYSIDQGWLTPLVRVVFGMGVGLLLLALGLRLDPRQRRFTPVLLGGGIATFYIVGFAAFQLYALVAYPVAFAFMVAVTLLAFFLAIQRDQPVLALIGALGGLGTPFLLYKGSGSFAALITYTCLILAWTTALFIYRGWWSVLWTAVVGGWTVYGVSYTYGLPTEPGEGITERWILQAAILFAAVAFWAVPLAREAVLAHRSPRAASPSAGSWWERLGELHLYLLSVTTPLLALGLSTLIWELPNASWGRIAIGCAAAFGLVGWGLVGVDRRLAQAQFLCAVILLPIGSLAALQEEVLFLALAAQAAAFHLLGRASAGRSVSAVAHLVALGVGVWLVVRLGVEPGGTGRSLTDLAALALLLTASTALRFRQEVVGYRFFVHLAFLAWIWRELYLLPNGAAYVSVAWGAYAVLLLVIGLRQGLPLLQRVAVGTLLLVAAKLFVIDLAALEALWRILLFLGLGGAFLFLSYSLQSLLGARVGVPRR